MRSFLLFSLLLFICPFIKGKSNFDFVSAFNGTIPGDPIVGDLYGAGLTYSSSTFMVGAQGASPTINGKFMDQAGAVYFYRLINNEWQQSQIPFTMSVTYDLLSSTVITSCGDWLFVAAPGTPLNQSNSYDKDFSGAILVFQRYHDQWIFVQTLYNPLGIQLGANTFFGFNVGCNDDGEWMIVGGAAISSAYLYKLNFLTNKWVYMQNVTFPRALVPPGNSPMLITPGYIFVAIDGDTVMVGQSVPPLQSFNSVVYVYTRIGEKWIYTQTIQGINNPISNNIGDFFGEFIDIDNDWAIISAPRDSEIAFLAGAVYFFHRENGFWILKQKVFSDRPSTAFGFGIGINDNIVVIGDSGRTVNGDIFRGAGIVYERIGCFWTPLPNGLLIDPEGRAYDWLGSGGLFVNENFIGLGTDSYLDNYLPSGFPGKRIFPFNPPNNNGRAVLYKIYN